MSGMHKPSCPACDSDQVVAYARKVIEVGIAEVDEDGYDYTYFEAGGAVPEAEVEFDDDEPWRCLDCDARWFPGDEGSHGTKENTFLRYWWERPS